MAPRTRPPYTMSGAVQGQAGSLAEVPLDLAIEDVRGQLYLALRTGDVALFLASTVRVLSILATAPDNTWDHIGNAAPGERP